MIGFYTSFSGEVFWGRDLQQLQYMVIAPIKAMMAIKRNTRVSTVKTNLRIHTSVVCRAPSTFISNIISKVIMTYSTNTDDRRRRKTQPFIYFFTSDKYIQPKARKPQLSVFYLLLLSILFSCLDFLLFFSCHILAVNLTPSTLLSCASVDASSQVCAYRDKL